ncbi:phage major capsid protein [Picosynechococcus sp. PCC 7117]|uniref:phage major capsid protein n=1 Tax=Picosynechococcus sp. PCC 7117 TaxID=195498 RepID=UPI0008108F6C|nr:phage major capsid protein [Picosynechococcus sp. PCC 7117]ANV88488.1 hypothetical protein AWQ22_14030 [Picosynechococcus sp. PCC 7117]
MSVIIDPVKSLQLVVEEEIASLPLGLYPMLNRLPKRVISQKVIKWNVNAGGAGVTGEATTADVSTFSDDAVVGAQLSIGDNRLRHSFQVQKEDIAQARAAGQGALRDLFGYEVQSGIRALMESMSDLVYTGAGTAGDGGVVGLEAVVTQDVAYAGIDPATYPLWESILSTDVSNRALTSTLLFDHEAAITSVGTGFTAVYTTPQIAARYKEVFAANVSINNNLPAGQADLGYTGLTYAGRPIIQDPYCTANTLYFVNEPEVTLYTFGQNNTANQNGMQVAVSALPSNNPDAEKYVIYVKGQLKVANRLKGVSALDFITQ